jgi:hypothetical protein
MANITINLEFDKRDFEKFKKGLESAVDRSSGIARDIIKKTMFLTSKEKQNLDRKDLGLIPLSVNENIIEGKRKGLLDSYNIKYDNKSIVFELIPKKEWIEKNLKSSTEYITKAITNLDPKNMADIFKRVLTERRYNV